jgi:hypothetical protein
MEFAAGCLHCMLMIDNSRTLKLAVIEFESSCACDCADRRSDTRRGCDKQCEDMRREEAMGGEREECVQDRCGGGDASMCRRCGKEDGRSEGCMPIMDTPVGRRVLVITFEIVGSPLPLDPLPI